jgi:sugar (pentulose or hexulose) kinase
MQIEEGAAYGAALLGHTAAGTFATVDETATVVRTMPEVTEPDTRAAQTYDALYDVYRSSYASLRDGMHRLSSLAEG